MSQQKESALRKRHYKTSKLVAKITKSMWNKTKIEKPKRQTLHWMSVKCKELLGNTLKACFKNLENLEENKLLDI